MDKLHAQTAHWQTLIVCLLAFACLHLSTSDVLAEVSGSQPIRAIFNPQPPYKVFSLYESVEVALKHFPQIRYARAKVMGAKADITLAKTAYLPRFDLAIQQMRTTHNLVGGTILAQSLDVIPMQSGMENKGSSFSNVWGSNYGANFNWLLYDFGQRAANVGLARAAKKYADASLRLTELDVAYAAADNYLRTIAAQQTIRANIATFQRMQAAAVEVHSLVGTGLRAGVDSALADYQVSQAKIKLIDSERTTELARCDLAESMGIAGTFIGIKAKSITRPPSYPYFFGRPIFSEHPLAEAKAAAVKTAAAKVHVLDRTWFPHIDFQSIFWGRGSGIRNSNTNPHWDGILPNSGNFAVGMTISFPALDIFEIKARRRKALAEELAERANLDLAIQILEQKDAKAKILLEDAKRIANETPILVKAARENQVKTLERYKVGLANMVAVAQAEAILADAEVEDAIAQVQVWRAILAAAYVQGNMAPFLDLVRAAEAATLQ